MRDDSTTVLETVGVMIYNERLNIDEKILRRYFSQVETALILRQIIRLERAETDKYFKNKRED